MDPRWVRSWFGLTALCVLVGVVLSVLTGINNAGGYFHSGVARGLNTFAFFTIQSNLIVGGTSLLLAIRMERDSLIFSVFRLTGVIAILVTGIVYHVALAQILELHSWDQLGNQLVHFAVPLLAVVGWLAFGPRGRCSGRVALWTVAFPVFWLVFTLVRGAFQPFYPYPFVDVTALGYPAVLLNCLWVAILFLGLAAAATALDRFMVRSRPGSPLPQSG